MNDNRPKNLALMTMRFPVTAIVSIMHRLSGIYLILSFPFLLVALQSSLCSQVSFDVLHDLLKFFWSRFIVWLFLSALMFHFVAGIRHLLMDFGLGETLSSARLGAFLVLFFSVLLMILMGAWVW